MSVTLEYPYTTPTESLVLPNPTFNNLESLGIKTTTLQAMDGFIRAYKRTPATYILDYTFDKIDRECVDLVAQTTAFLLTAYGSWIKLTDWKAVVWKMKCTTDPAEFATTGRRFNTLNLSFEGTKV